MLLCAITFTSITYSFMFQLAPCQFIIVILRYKALLSRGLLTPITQKPAVPSHSDQYKLKNVICRLHKLFLIHPLFINLFLLTLCYLSSKLSLNYNNSLHVGYISYFYSALLSLIILTADFFIYEYFCKVVQRT